MKENPVFTVIEGGLSAGNAKSNSQPHSKPKNYSIFRSAQVTRSRLMGVCGLHISYAPADGSSENIHHFFYLDYEEYGIDSYHILVTDNEDDADRKKVELFGGLGEPWADITERESLYLVEYSYASTLNKGLPAPEEFERPDAIKFRNIDFGLDEFYTLHSKMCVNISSDYELINYFLMRLAGMDHIMAQYLSESSVDFDDFPVKVPSALCSNTVDKDELRENGYICESLIDEDDQYYLVISRVTVSKNKSNPKIASYELVSCNKISNKEASMIMNKEHFIVINLLSKNSEQDRAKVKKWLRSRFDTMTISDYENTSILMVFNSNNAHVNQKRYRIDNDLLGMMFYTQAGELVIDAISPIKAAVISQSLIEAPVEIESAGAVKFKEAIMIPFIDSGFDSFIDYIQTIQK